MTTRVGLNGCRDIARDDYVRLSSQRDVVRV